MEFHNIVLEKKEGVATITLNRPKVRNALDTQTLLEIGAAVEDIDNDPDVRVVLITGAGTAFCSGADLSGIASLVDKPRDYFLRLWNRVFSAIDNLGKPVIAVINGTALAGGLELVMACDLAVASEDARLSDQHATYGLVPGGGGSQRLPRLIGIRKAKELLYTGDWLSATEAERFGLINKVVPANKLKEATNELVAKLLSKSPMALKTVKRLVNYGMESPLAAALEMELVGAIAHSSTEDLAEGIKAFMEKRPPVFPGR
jgi:enoyl-CoA hydratase/carnithine racemase